MKRLTETWFLPTQANKHIECLLIYGNLQKPTSEKTVRKYYSPEIDKVVVAQEKLRNIKAVPTTKYETQSPETFIMWKQTRATPTQMEKNSCSKKESICCRSKNPYKQDNLTHEIFDEKKERRRKNGNRRPFVTQD